MIILPLSRQLSNEQVTDLFLLAKNVYSVFDFKYDSKSSACFVRLERTCSWEIGPLKGPWHQSTLTERPIKN